MAIPGGQCKECKRLGFIVGEACKDCGDLVGLLYAIEEGQLGGVETEYLGRCSNCDRFGDIGCFCPTCEDSGMIFDTLIEQDKEELLEGACEPSCHHEQCRILCREISSRFSKQVNSATSFIDTVRAYDVMVENGLRLRLTFADEVTGRANMYKQNYSHHAKLCHCSLCKFCVITKLDRP
jgi:hypothetical protein